MSDRSQLTVSKPSPLNARQEAFARSIAEGRSQREAYKRAGYTPTSDGIADVNASRLLRHAQVQSRIRDPDAPAEVAVEVWLREIAPPAGD